jgi:hypothetical protein
METVGPSTRWRTPRCPAGLEQWAAASLEEELTVEQRGADAPTPADAGSLPLDGNSNPREGQVSSHKPKATPRADEPTRLPKGWSLPDEWRRWALANFHVTAKQVQFEADKFDDYWPSEYGPKCAKLDWRLTWQNWCRRAFGAKAAKLATLPDPDAARAQREYDEALARLRAEEDHAQ